MKKFYLLFAMMAVLCTACDEDENLDRDPRVFTVDDSGKLTGINKQYMIVTVPADMQSLDVNMVSDGKITFTTEKSVPGVSADYIPGYTFEDGVIHDYIAYTREAKKKPRFLQAIKFNVANPLVVKQDTAEIAIDCVLPDDPAKDTKVIIALVGGSEYKVETKNLTKKQLEKLYGIEE